MPLADEYLAMREEQEKERERSERGATRRRQRSDGLLNAVQTAIGGPIGVVTQPFVDAVATRGGREDLGHRGRRIGESIQRSADRATRDLMSSPYPLSDMFGGIADAPAAVARTARQAPAAVERVVSQVPAATSGAIGATAREAPHTLERAGDALRGVAQVGRALATPQGQGRLRGLVRQAAATLGSVAAESTVLPLMDQRTARTEMDAADLAGDEEAMRAAAARMNEATGRHALNLSALVPIGGAGRIGRGAAPMRRAGSVNLADEAAEVADIPARTMRQPSAAPRQRQPIQEVPSGELDLVGDFAEPVSRSGRAANPIVPLAVPGAIAGGAGALALGSDAEAQEGASPELVAARARVTDLETKRKRFESVNSSDRTAVRQMQNVLKAENFYTGEFTPDGEWGPGTDRAYAQYLARYDQLIKDAKTERDELDQEESSRRNRPGPLTQAWRNLGPVALPIAALALGHGSRLRAAHSPRLRAEAAASVAQANARLPRNPTPLKPGQNAAAARRVGELNAFWAGGLSPRQQHRVPFEPTTSGRATRGFRARTDVAPTSDLYRESTIARFPDYAMVGGGVADAAVMSWNLANAQREEEAAREALESDPTNERKQIRLEDAITQVRTWEAFQRAGVALALGRGSGTFFHRYPSARQNINIGVAEAERVRLNQFLAAKKPPRKPRAPPPPPPPRPASPRPTRRRRSSP